MPAWRRARRRQNDARRLAAHDRRQPDRRVPDCETGAVGHGAAQAGRIVFIASTAGLKGYGYVAPYVAAKHGVVGLMRALAAELAKTGVTVNAVCPGFVETEMLEELVSASSRRPAAASTRRAPVSPRPIRRDVSCSRKRSRQRYCGCERRRGLDHRPGDFGLGRGDMVSTPLRNRASHGTARSGCGSGSGCCALRARSRRSCATG